MELWLGGHLFKFDFRKIHLHWISVDWISHDVFLCKSLVSENYIAEMYAEDVPTPVPQVSCVSSRGQEHENFLAIFSSHVTLSKSIILYHRTLTQCTVSYQCCIKQYELKTCILWTSVLKTTVVQVSRMRFWGLSGAKISLLCPLTS